MAYTANHTDVANYGSLVIEDKTINQDTSLSLVGRLYPGYSKIISENFLHLLENFASHGTPSNPTRGQLWFNTDSVSITPQPKLMMWNGSRWMPVGLITRSNSEPDAIVGDLWVDTRTNSLNMYVGGGINTNGWITFLTNYDAITQTGIKPVVINDTSSQPHDAIVVYVNSHSVAILSADTEYVPNDYNIIEDFVSLSIKPGINIPPLIHGIPVRFNGLASIAESIVSGNSTISSTDLFIKNKLNETTGSIVIKSEDGLSINTIDGNKSLTIKPTPNSISITSINDIVMTSNSPTSATNISLLPSKISINKSLEVVDASITTKNISVSAAGDINLLTSNSITVNKINITHDGKILQGSDQLAYGFIGSSVKRWDTIYSDTIDAFTIGTPSTRYSGTLDGTVTFNDNEILNESTLFHVIGDTTATTTVTGAAVNINTILRPDIITSKPAVTSALSTDMMLIQRVTELKSMPLSYISHAITIVGSIMVYAGTVIPAGYLLCDGSSLSKTTDYSTLYAAIGNTYGSTDTTFNIPTIPALVPNVNYYIYTGNI